MKKFWNLMLAALVVLGAVACSEKSENLDSAPQQGLSFEATIDLAETRTDVVFNEGTGKWDTVWTGDETLTVKSGWTVYDFKNSAENKNRFVCANDAAKDLVGKQVEIFLTHDADYNTLNSKAGKAGGKIKATVESFNPAEDVNLQVESAFLRYSSAYEVTLDASAYIFDYNGNVRNTITLPAGNDVWVAINTADEVTLSYSINGEKCKEKTLNLAAKKIYNLGELELPKPEYKIYVYKYNNDWTTVNLYSWDDAGALHTGAWPGSTTAATETINGYEYMVWTMPTAANDTNLNVILNNGTAQTADFKLGVLNQDYYLLLNGTALSVIEDKENPEPAVPTTAYKVYVYQYNNTWTSVNLYSWDAAGANPTGGWPGTKSTTTETINGYEYLVWEMPISASNTQLSIILNDGSAQTADFALGVLDKDYYLLLNGTTLSFVEDKENPEPEVVQGEPQPSTWALAGDFNSWGDLVMYTTDTDNLFVAKGVAIGAYKEVKVKAVGNWNTSYGGGINYLKTNIWTKVYSGGSNLSIINAGTYDIYFDNANKRIYVMTEGTDIATATEQAANGAAPDLSGASWGLCGAHNNWGTPDIKLEWDGTIGLYVALNAKLTGEFKVRANNSWGEDYGCGGTITVNATAGKSMSRGGGNCKVASGTYDVYWDLSGKKIWVKTPGSAAPTK